MANSESCDRIEDAFNEALREHEFLKDGDILGQWLIIGHVANPDSTQYGYPMLFSNGSIDAHIARGLLHTGLLMFGTGDSDGE